MPTTSALLLDSDGTASFCDFAVSSVNAATDSTSAFSVSVTSEAVTTAVLYPYWAFLMLQPNLFW